MSERAFQNKKSLEEIKPAQGGVKLKRRDPEVKKEVKHNPPQIIQNVKPEDIMEFPTEEALKLVAKSSNSKEELLLAMREFNGLLKIRVLSENKTEDEKKQEQSVVSKLAQAALDVEDLSPHEGLLSLSILAIRQALSLRDAGNEMAYKISQLESKMKILEEKVDTIKSSTPPTKSEVEAAKKQLVEASDLLRRLSNSDE